MSGFRTHCQYLCSERISFNETTLLSLRSDYNYQLLQATLILIKSCNIYKSRVKIRETTSGKEED